MILLLRASWRNVWIPRREWMSGFSGPVREWRAPGIRINWLQGVGVWLFSGFSRGARTGSRVTCGWHPNKLTPDGGCLAFPRGATLLAAVVSGEGCRASCVSVSKRDVRDVRHPHFAEHRALAFCVSK
jgi:hypothetical protein